MLRRRLQSVGLANANPGDLLLFTNVADCSTALSETICTSSSTSACNGGVLDGSMHTSMQLIMLSDPTYYLCYAQGPFAPDFDPSTTSATFIINYRRSTRGSPLKPAVDSPCPVLALMPALPTAFSGAGC